MGVIFAKKAKARKMQILPPRENSHVYSTCLGWVGKGSSTQEGFTGMLEYKSSRFITGSINISSYIKSEYLF